MSEIALTNTINVSLTATPQGLSDYNINSIGLFSNEEAAFSDEYRVYVGPRDVVTDFGTSSRTAAMANAIFAQMPNFRTGGGSLYIIPFVAVDATSGSLETADISANLAGFQAVTDGKLKVTIDGIATTITKLNFTGAADLADVAKVISDSGIDCLIEASATKIKFSSKIVGSTSTIAISAASTPSGGTDLSGASYLNYSTGTTVAGGNSTATETLIEAVNRIEPKIFFGGILTTQLRENALVLTDATAIQAMDKIQFVATGSLNNIAVLGTALKSAGDSKTRLLAYSQGIEESQSAIAAYASISLSPNFAGTNRANTMNLKSLATILPDLGLSQTYFTSAETNGVDVYGGTGGLGFTYSNDNNGYTDDVVNQLWLKKKLEVAGFNYLAQTNTKIPQTEIGMAGLKNAYAQVLEQAKRAGIIGTGLAWNSSERFGDPEDFDRNIKEQGYYIYSLPIAQQAQIDRTARKAPVVQIAMKYSGAIHHSDVIGVIER